MTSIKSSTELTFPEFDDIKVSTKTFIVMTNIIVDLKKLFDFLPVTEYVALPKKRGRKKKSNIFEYNKDIAQGSIITLKFENQLRGVDLKQKKSLKKKVKWFRNSFTVVMINDNKPINFKICQNGMFQITGCKFDKHAEDCVKYIWDYIKDQDKSIFTFKNDAAHFETIFIPVMRNIDFSVGFLVDREKLTRYMNTQTQFHSLLETSFGYTGCNIKIPITRDITTMDIKKLTFEDDKIVETKITYGEYLKCLSEKERTKKLNKNRYNTFLVFHSGRTIYSGLTYEYMKETYYYFLEIMRTCYDQIEERLD